MNTEGCAFKALQGLDNKWVPTDKASLTSLQQTFTCCTLKSTKTDPDEWFNELYQLNKRFEAIDPKCKKEYWELQAHILANLPDEYKHEPELGLACGNDGLDLVREMLRQASSMLNDEGVLFVEVGNSQVHLQAAYPEIPFQWIEFSIGGHGVFVLTKAQLDTIKI